MALSDTQLRQLKAKLDARHVKTRKADGTELHYVEGWHVIAEANRIFGYDAWDRRTVATNCVSSSGNGQRHVAAYTAKVRITVRAGDINYCAGRFRNGRRSGSDPRSGARDGSEERRDRRHQAGARHVRQPIWARPLRPRAAGRTKRRGQQSRIARGHGSSARRQGPNRSSFEKPSEFAAALRVSNERRSRHRDSVRNLGAERRNGSRNKPKPETGSSPEIRHRTAAGRSSQAMRHRSREAARRFPSARRIRACSNSHQRSTRACSRSVRQSGSAARSTCGL